MDCFRSRDRFRSRAAWRRPARKTPRCRSWPLRCWPRGRLNLHRIPRLDDVRVMLRVLAGLGAEIHGLDDGGVGIVAPDEGPFIVPTRLARAMRASFCVLGPLLARRGRAVVPLPGGCRIGPRPIDLHLAGLAALGADLSIDGDRVVGRAERCAAPRSNWRARTARPSPARPTSCRPPCGPGQNGHPGGCPRARDRRPGPLLAIARRPDRRTRHRRDRNRRRRELGRRPFTR